jgi:hypothetical protein
MLLRGHNLEKDRGKGVLVSFLVALADCSPDGGIIFG